MHTLLTYVACLFLLAGCDNYPKDMRDTLNHIRTSEVIRVGVINNSPWAHISNGKVVGIEVEIITSFSQSLNAVPAWEIYPESQAIENLKHNKLDIVIGGLVDDNPRKKEVAFTRPYAIDNEPKQKKHVFALAKGENALMAHLEIFLKNRKHSVEY